MAQNGPKIRTRHVERVSWRCYDFHRGDDRAKIRFHCVAIRVMMATPLDHVANAIRVIAMPSEHSANAIRVIAMPLDHVECSCNSTLFHCNTMKFHCIAMGFKILIFSSFYSNSVLVLSIFDETYTYSKRH